MSLISRDYLNCRQSWKLCSVFCFAVLLEWRHISYLTCFYFLGLLYAKGSRTMTGVLSAYSASTVLPQHATFPKGTWTFGLWQASPSGNHFPSSNACYQHSLDLGYAHFGSPFFLTSQKILWNYKILVDWWKAVLLCLPAEKNSGDELCDLRPGPQKL